MGQVKKMKYGANCAPVHRQIQLLKSKRVKPAKYEMRSYSTSHCNIVNIVVKKIKTPITVKKTLPIDIRLVNRPMIISKVLRPLQIKNIHDPVTVDRIARPISISRVENPVIVEQVKQPIIIKAIETPSVIQNVIKPLKVSGIQSPVVVQRIEDSLSMNPLSQSVDKITIYGSNSSAPVQTDDFGRIIFSGQVQVAPVMYTEKSFTRLQSQDQIQSLPSQDVSIQTNLSYAVVNQSAEPVIIYLEISPNDVDYMTDSSTVVSAFSTQSITPLRFLRYAKISYQSAKTDHSVIFDIYYQAQSG